MHCVDLGESFPTSIYLLKSASIQPRTSPSKFGGNYSILFNRVLIGCPSKANAVAPAIEPSSCGELSRFFEQELVADMDSRADHEAVRARSAEIGLPRPIADLDENLNATTAGGLRPSVGIHFQEGIRAELNSSTFSPSLLPPTQHHPLSCQTAVDRSSRKVLQHWILNLSQPLSL